MKRPRFKDILEVLSYLIVIGGTIYGIVTPYLTDLWKGVVLGGLVVFLLMIGMNTYDKSKLKISMPEAKQIALQDVKQERTDAIDVKVDSVELVGRRWHVKGNWHTKDGPATIFFEVVMDGHSGKPLKRSFNRKPDPFLIGR